MLKQRESQRHWAPQRSEQTSALGCVGVIIRYQIICASAVLELQDRGRISPDDINNVQALPHDTLCIGHGPLQGLHIQQGGMVCDQPAVAEVWRS